MHLLFVMHLAATSVAAAPSPALSQAQVDALMKDVDVRGSDSGTDYFGTALIASKSPDGQERVLQVNVYRREQTKSLIILFTKPKTQAGQGNLRIDYNLWYYDPRVGKWERQTERQRIGDTEAHRRDFDNWGLSEDFNAAFDGEDKVGDVPCYRLKLTSKPNVDTEYPVMLVWIEKKTGNPLKVQGRTETGKPIQTKYFLDWTEITTPIHKFYPKQRRIYNEVEKGNQSTVVVQSAVFKPLPENIFTKAWMESQSR